MRPRPLLASLAMLAMQAFAACTTPPPVRPPAAEFLVAAGDSTYWVRPAASRMRLRSSPILLARLDSRFHEVYVTEDVRAYDDATFIGQRVWRRDLVRGDSVLVFEDTLAPAAARRWLAANPDARILPPGDPHPEEPAASVVVDVVVIAVHGPYVSLEYHADIESATEQPWHTTRRAVVDLRSGRPVSVAELFGAGAARAAVRDARRSFLAAVDSIAASPGARAAALATTLDGFAFDPASFSLAGDAAAPAIAFFVPGRGEGEAGDVAIPLPELVLPAPGWWGAVREGLPAIDDAEPVDRWDHGRYMVTAEYDEHAAVLTLSDERDREWPVGHVQAPVHHILWLDAPAVDSLTRRGLRRAFDEAVFYDDKMQTASFTPPVARARCASTPAATRRRG